MKNNHSARDLTNNRGQGLCRFCEAETRCTLMQPSDLPVLECEEFRITVRPTKSDVNAVNVPGNLSGESSSPAHSSLTDWSRKGLCGNCAIFDTCPFSKDEGGVWRCEEYR